MSSNENNHSGATFICDSTAEAIKEQSVKDGKQKPDCLNPIHNCRGSVSGRAFPANGKSYSPTLNTAMFGCKTALNTEFGKKAAAAASSTRNAVTSFSKRFSPWSRKSTTGGKSRRRRKKSHKKRKKKGGKKSRRKSKKSRRRKSRKSRKSRRRRR